MTSNPHDTAAPLVDLWRGGRLESRHCGHAVVASLDGIVHQWGDADALTYPRSSVKIMQAMPLLMSGAGLDLSARQLALACSSHNAAAIHVDLVRSWLDDLGLSPDDLRCGPQPPRDKDVKFDMIRSHGTPCQVHNNCSGKHTGFLMLSKHLKAGPEYLEIDHPVQQMVRESFETLIDAPSPGYGIDGCSAPNFAATVGQIARAMAWFATAHTRSDTMSQAAARLVAAMAAHPDYVAGEGRACTHLMRAMDGVAIKTGAEGFFVAIIPSKGLGVALKIADGATRASEAAISQILIGLGVLEPGAQSYVDAPIRNWRGIETGRIEAAQGFQL